VARLAVRLRQDGFIKNPPIVAPIPGTERYVVLDGANRTSALIEIGAPHAIAQVVEYGTDQVQLLTWHHLVTGRDPETFLAEIRDISGLAVDEAAPDAARRALAARDVLAYVISPPRNGHDSSTAHIVNPVTHPPDEHVPFSAGATGLLNAMVDTYKSDPQVAIHRVGTDQIDELLEYYDDVSGLVVFPPYSPHDILRLAMSGQRVPTGITRHIISPRALRVNIPIHFLLSDYTLEEKNAWWSEQIKRKLAANEIRLYQESTYLFDE
jgi:hypothetical protein